MSFKEKYKYIHAWVVDGWIEVGLTEYSNSMVRASDEGGMIYESNPQYPTLIEE